MDIDDGVLVRGILRLGLVDEQLLEEARKESVLGGSTLSEVLIRKEILSEAELRVVCRFEDMEPGLETLNIRYTIQAKLGMGSMGVVYRAVDNQLNRPVALKLLAGVTDEDSLKRFEREAKLSAKLAHPGIVSVYDAEMTGSTPYIAMEFVDGVTLADILKSAAGEHHVLTVQQEKHSDDLKSRIKLLCRISEAIGFAHSKGVMHRDLKPANILVDAKGRPHVADFGLARDLTGDASLTGTGFVVGTPYYLSPEQARGSDRIDERSDIYALGILLYECLTLRRPFEEPSIPVLLRQVSDEEPVPPSRHQPGIHQDLETICLKALQKEPAHRYATAEEFRQDLEFWLRGEPIRGRAPGTALTLARRIRRHRVVAAVVAAVVVCFAAFGFYLSRSPALLEFDLKPVGAVMCVDGREFRNGPISLAPGDHLIEVKLEGYTPVRKSIRVDRGRTTSVRYELQPVSAYLGLEASSVSRFRIAGGDVDLRGETPWGPTRLRPGKYRLEAWDGRGALISREIDLRDGMRLNLDLEFNTPVLWSVNLGKMDENPLLMDCDGDGVKDVIVPSDARRLHVVSGARGRILWEKGFPTDDFSDPAEYHLDGRTPPEIVIGNGPSRVVVLDAKEGHERIVVKVNQKGYAASHRGSDSRLLVFLSRSATLFCIRHEDGSGPIEKWRKAHGGRSRMAPAISDTDGDGRLEVVMATDRGVCVHDLESGERIGRSDLAESPNTPILLHDMTGDDRPEILIGCENGSLVCIDPVSMKRLWTHQSNGRVWGRPAVGDLNGDGTPDVVYGSDDHRAYAVNGRDGSTLWSFRTGDQVQAQAAIGDLDGDGRLDVLIGSDDFHLYMLDGASGSERWSFRTGGDIDSAVLLLDVDKDGRPEVIVASNDWNLYCLKPFGGMR